MINTAPYNLNMAFIGKGITYFDSEYVFITTNLMGDDFDSTQWDIGLTEPEAFKKRMHLVLLEMNEVIPQMLPRIHLELTNAWHFLD
jgi:hypothetical protein